MPTLEENQQFERYQIQRWVGNGVSGESYVALDTTLQRIVTLKLIHPWTVLPEADRRQFFRELSGINTLNHPYLASIMNYGELDGKLYVVRRHVSSGSLLSEDGRLWYQPPLSIAAAIRFVSQLAQALTYIHEQGYLHGSLTLSNILVLRGGTIDQQDEGFAPFLVADVGLANFVRRFGQPVQAYLPLTAAPEQLGNRVTIASDQYALAVILYFWLSGSPTFVGTPKEITHMKLAETITPLSTLNANISIEQESIIRRALSVYPEERYPSIMAFADALIATLPPLRDQIPNPEPLPTPAPEPLPVPAPEPLPHPAPEPLPQPAPEPLPQPAPEPLPEPAPEPLPKPSPDVFTPLPGTDPAPKSPPSPLVSEVYDAASSLQNVAPVFQHPSALPFLVVYVPETPGSYEFVLHNDEITIGRAGDSDILLEQDMQASRHHALLRRENASYLLYDLHSASGVFVNGEKLSLEDGYQLIPGDKITIGNHEMVLQQAVSVAEQIDASKLLV